MADPLALYVHWPFCVAKCPYCDFNSHVRTGVDQAAWRTALLTDLAHEAVLTPGRRIGSIFFGGGTPSLMPPATVAVVIAAAERAWGLAEDVEITLEANPNSAEAARFADLAAAGVNRLSLGLQALDDAALRFLGRVHDLREGLAALERGQRLFGRVSFDLIYARPGQTLAAWQTELAQALAFGTEHLSLYQLTIEPGTRFATLAARGALALPDGDAAADLFEATRARTAAAGLPGYEVSNHARPGAESRHNLVYWRYQDYIGIGPGAHGRRDGRATVRRRKPEQWLAAVTRDGHGIAEEDLLSPHSRRIETLLMGLRLREGVALSPELSAALDQSALERLAAQGLIRCESNRLTVTERGMPVLEAVLRAVVG